MPYVGRDAASFTTVVDVTVSDDLTVTDDATIGGALSAKGGAVFNEDSADVDFRIESNGNANMLFVDGGNDAVGIGTSSPNFTLQVDSQRADATFDANDLDTWADFKIQGQTSSGNARGIYFDFDSDTGNDKGAGIVGISGDGTGGVGSLGFITTAGNSSAERMRIDSDGQIYTTSTLSAGANTDMANGYVADSGAVYTRGVIASNSRSNNTGYLSGFAIVNGDNSANGGGAAGGRIVANVSALCVTSDSNAGDDSGGDLVISTKPEAGNLAERMRIESGGDIAVKTGDIYFSTAGKGIVLGATSNTDANTLHDYEEGTWTPRITASTAGVATAGSGNNGYYTKVGNLVKLSGRIQWTEITTALDGNRQISGLPFTVKNSTGNLSGTMMIRQYNGFSASSQHHAFSPNVNATTADVISFGGGSGSGQNYTHLASVSASGYVYDVHITYIAAD